MKKLLNSLDKPLPDKFYHSLNVVFKKLPAEWLWFSYMLAVVILSFVIGWHYITAAVAVEDIPVDYRAGLLAIVYIIFLYKVGKVYKFVKRTIEL